MPGWGKGRGEGQANLGNARILKDIVTATPLLAPKLQIYDDESKTGFVNGHLLILLCSALLLRVRPLQVPNLKINLHRFPIFSHLNPILKYSHFMFKSPDSCIFSFFVFLVSAVYNLISKHFPFAIKSYVSLNFSPCILTGEQMDRATI